MLEKSMKGTISCAAAFITAILPQMALAERCRTDKVKVDGITRHYSPYAVHGQAAGYNHDKFGTEYRNGQAPIRRDFAAYVSSFDTNDDDNGDARPDILGVPDFVAYEIKAYRDPHTGRIGRPSSWKRPRPWYTWHGHEFDHLRNRSGVRVPRLDDSYKGVGRIWNRGHLQMKFLAERVGHEAACNTHFFWNAVPQAAMLNQGPWLDLEFWTGAAANKYGSVWVVTGPIYDLGKPLRWIGGGGEIPVAVPDALFKIIIRETENNVPEVLSFIFPNHSDYNACRVQENGRFGAYDHTQYMTTLQDIQDQTGLEFLTNLPEGVRRQLLEKEPPSQLWSVEPEFGQLSCGVR